MITVEYEPLSPEKQQIVLGRIEKAREDGALRTQAESNISSEYALRQFEYACVRFNNSIDKSDKSNNKPDIEGRRNARKYAEELDQAIGNLQAALNSVVTLIGDDLYSGMPERVFDALAQKNPRSADELATATSYSRLSADPLEWRTGRTAASLLFQLTHWTPEAKARLAEITSSYSNPGRDPGSPASDLAADLLYLLRLLDRSETNPVRPIRPKTLKDWLDFAFLIVGKAPDPKIGVVAKHAVAKAGPAGTWRHPAHPSATGPMSAVRISIDHLGNRTRIT